MVSQHSRLVPDYGRGRTGWGPRANKDFPHYTPVRSNATPTDIAEFLRDRKWVAMTGAGVSTDSGIPDYRGPDAPPANPMMYGDYIKHEDSRQRYWARSLLGFRSFGVAQPNPGHVALANLAASKNTTLVRLITQNVDGLHNLAGSPNVLELHGAITRVICLDCTEISSRFVLQERLDALNPDIRGTLPAGDAELRSGTVQLRPDGDAFVEDWSDFVVAPCVTCGGVLKPDVVFFGESVPKPVVAEAFAAVDRADILLVAGSSLMVMSALRFVKHAHKAGKPVIIINRGPTRGDEYATLRVNGGTSETLSEVAALLCDLQDDIHS